MHILGLSHSLSSDDEIVVTGANDSDSKEGLDGSDSFPPFVLDFLFLLSELVVLGDPAALIPVFLLTALRVDVVIYMVGAPLILLLLPVLINGSIISVGNILQKFKLIIS